MSSPERVTLTRIVTTKSCFAGTIVRAKWSQVNSASRQLSGLESRKGPPDHVAVAESEEMVAAEGVDAVSGQAGTSIQIIIEESSQPDRADSVRQGRLHRVPLW